MQATGILSPQYFPLGLAPQMFGTIGMGLPQQGIGAQSGPYVGIPGTYGDNSIPGPEFGAHAAAQQLLATLGHLAQQVQIQNAVTQQIGVALHHLHQLAQHVVAQSLYARVGALGQQQPFGMGGQQQQPFGQQPFGMGYGQSPFSAGVGQPFGGQQPFGAPWQSSLAGQQPFGAFGGQLANGLPGLSQPGWAANRQQTIQ
jgi:hypothetical protein